MKLTVNTQSLTNAVAIANNYVLTTEGDFRGKLVMSGAKGNIIVKATNYIETIVLKNISFTSSDLTVDNFNAFSIDAKKLLTVLRAAKTDEVIMEIEKSSLIIKSGRSKVVIELLAEAQEIKTPSNSNYLNIDSNLVADFKKVYHAIDSNNPKYELNGVLIQISGGKMNLVSTDTKRLSVCEITTSDNDLEVIVPKDGISSIIKLFGTDNVIAEIGNTTLTVKTNNISYSTNLISGKYPTWGRIVPQSTSKNISIGRTKLLEMVKEASLFEQQIAIDIKGGKIVIKDKDGNTEIEDTIETEEIIDFNINAKNIIDFLSSYDGEMVKIGFNASSLPIVLFGNSNYKEVVMPIIVKAVEVAEVQKVAA